MSRRASSVVPSLTPHQHDATRAPRWRFADPKKRLRGCPLRSDYDSAGTLRLVACADLKGTLESCARCQRHGGEQP